MRLNPKLIEVRDINTVQEHFPELLNNIYRDKDLMSLLVLNNTYMDLLLTLNSISTYNVGIDFYILRYNSATVGFAFIINKKISLMKEVYIGVFKQYRRLGIATEVMIRIINLYGVNNLWANLNNVNSEIISLVNKIGFTIDYKMGTLPVTYCIREDSNNGIRSFEENIG